MKRKTSRADSALVERGLAPSVAEAAKLILAGRVRVGPDHVVRHAADLLPDAADLRVAGVKAYVSRGAYKLVPALDKYLPDLSGLIVLDIGASTGGFTDLALRRGAAKVYAVDAGTGQLALSLRRDPRVVVMEKTNARYLSAETIPEKVDVLTMDVSFISVTKILPAAATLLRDDAWAFILIKPQFEAEKQQVEPGGVVTDDAVRRDVADRVDAFVAETLKWRVVDRLDSPIEGPSGNREMMAVYRAPKAVAR